MEESKRTLSAAERRAFLQSLPFVRYVRTHSVPCDGFRWSSMPLKALYKMSSKHVFDPTLKDKYACKNPARWVFKALKNSDAKSGTYCMSHLLSQFQTNVEHPRITRYWKRWREIHG